MGKTVVPEGDFGPPIKHDPTFNGPNHRRSCTDIICLIVFLVFVVCWGVVCGYAFMRGDVTRLLAPTDTDGKRCGFSDGVKDKPYLVFFDFSKCLDAQVALYGCKTRQLCVKECPKQTRQWDLISANMPEVEFNQIRNELVCLPEINVNEVTQVMLTTYIAQERCAKQTFKSKSESKRCLPENMNEVGRQVMPDFESMSIVSRDMLVKEWTKTSNVGIKMNEMGAKIIEDLTNLKWWLLLALFVVMIISMIYIVIMRWIAGPVVWFSLLAIIGLLSWSIYLCYVNYDYYSNLIKEPEQISSIGGAFESMGAQKETWIVLMILACIALFIVLIMLIFLRKRIVIAIALIKEGSKAVSSVWSSLFFPIFPWILQILVLALFISVCVFLTTIGDDTYQIRTNRSPACAPIHGKRCTPSDFIADPNCPEATCIFTGVTNYPVVPWMQAWNAVGFFWMMFFIQGVGDMILAGVFATWYWTFHKKDVPFFTLTKSVSRTLCYNLGTVAFGSLIIAICRMIRVAIEFVQQKCMAYDNCLTKCLFCFCRCFFACLESFLRFINKNAYIMCAIHGKAFCASARDSFSLLMRNIVRVVVLDKTTGFLFFLSKLVVAMGCGAAAYYIFREPIVEDTINMSMNYDLVPALIVGIFAYFIASIFFGVYSMAVDTLFLCFLEDLERNDGSAERPYFMSKNLMRVLGKKNK